MNDLMTEDMLRKVSEDLRKDIVIKTPETKKRKQMSEEQREKHKKLMKESYKRKNRNKNEIARKQFDDMYTLMQKHFGVSDKLNTLDVGVESSPNGYKCKCFDVLYDAFCNIK